VWWFRVQREDRLEEWTIFGTFRGRLESTMERSRRVEDLPRAELRAEEPKSAERKEVEYITEELNKLIQLRERTEQEIYRLNRRPSSWIERILFPPTSTS
jgi:hypothetical protein